MTTEEGKTQVNPLKISPSSKRERKEEEEEEMEHQKDLTEVMEGKLEQQQKNLNGVGPVSEQKDLTEVLEGKFEQQQKNLSEVGEGGATTVAGKDGEKKEKVEEGLPMESSPYLNYKDVEDYKRQAYGTEGQHLEPKVGAGAGATDAPTPGAAGAAPPSKEEDKAVKPH